MAHSTTNREDTDGPGEELTRYRELLEPLEQMSTSGSATLPGEEREAWDRAVASSHADQTDAIEIEESISTFARVLWAAPGWSEPPARIARALVLRARRWSDAERPEAIAIAQRFADRASRIDSAALQARIATVEVKLALGDLAGAEKAAAVLPSNDLSALALRSAIAVERGDQAGAARLCEQRLELQTEPGEIRAARLQLASLRDAAGDLDGAETVLREGLAEYPDHAAGHLALGRLLHRRDALLEAFAELDSAAVLGLDESRAQLDEIAAELDRRSLVAFRESLRHSRDGEVYELCPAAATASDTGTGN